MALVVEPSPMPTNRRHAQRKELAAGQVAQLRLVT